MSRASVWANLIFMLLGVGLLGLLAACTSNPRKTLLLQTGITACRSAIVKPLHSDYEDVSRFAVSASPEECIPSLSTAIINASKGDCRDLIDMRGGCSYAFGHRTVMVEKMSKSGNINLYEIISW
jgi:hypothetical protein